MDVWDTALPGKPPRIQIMSGWGGRCFGGHGRLLLTYAEARAMHDQSDGDAVWTTEQLLPLVSHALLHGNVTTTSIRMTGRAA